MVRAFCFFLADHSNDIFKERLISTSKGVIKMTKKQMSIYSKEIADTITSNWGFSRQFRYVLMTEKSYWDFVRKDSKELDRWNRILESGFISTLDICRTFERVDRLKHIKAYELGGTRSFVEKKLEKAGYYSYKDRSVYKDGSVFWKLSEVEHVFDGIRAQIEKFINDLTPKQTFWNGKLLSVWYRYSGVKLFVEEVRLEKKAYDEEEQKRRIAAILADEKAAEKAMDDMFEKKRQGSRMSITELMELHLRGLMDEIEEV